MKKIMIGVVAATLVTGGVVFATHDPTSVKNNTEVSHMTTEDERPQDVNLPVDSSIEVVAEPAQTTSQPETPAQTDAQDVSEPFDAQLYAQGVLQAKVQAGMNVNVDCYTKLFNEAHGWQLTQVEVDQVIEKVMTQYSSSCAAYAEFKEKGTY